MENVSYLVGEFVDYLGKEHKIVICGLLLTESNYFDKVLSIGYSICNPNDEFNLDLGKKIALSRAQNYDRIISTNTPGILNNNLIDFILKSDLDFYKSNPDYIIRGYTDAKNKYERKQELKAEISKMSEVQLEIVKALAKCTADDINNAKEIAKLLPIE